jgi:hypothetical protein
VLWHPKCKKKGTNLYCEEATCVLTDEDMETILFQFSKAWKYKSTVCHCHDDDHTIIMFLTVISF